MKSIPIFLFIFLFCTSTCFAQSAKITILDSGKNSSIRGLSVVTDKVIWCSGSNGSVAKSVDGGKSFNWSIIKGYEKNDFRDIEAFDENTAIVMSIGMPAVILKTKNGGKSWQKVFEDSTQGMFLDAMDFDKSGNGCVIGDPINGNLFRAVSNDYGDTWGKSTKNIFLEKGEAFFASSGTNIQNADKSKEYIFVSGGIQSRLFYKNIPYHLNIVKGKESTGANAISFYKNKAIIVGGDYLNNKRNDSNCVLVNLNKFPKFSVPQTSPLGYRSCVIYISKNKLICCGTSGVDVSKDGGKNWINISHQSFHVVQKSKKGKSIFLAGSNGKLALFSLK